MADKGTLVVGREQDCQGALAAASLWLPSYSSSCIGASAGLLPEQLHVLPVMQAQRQIMADKAMLVVGQEQDCQGAFRCLCVPAQAALQEGTQAGLPAHLRMLACLGSMPRVAGLAGCWCAVTGAPGRAPSEAFVRHQPHQLGRILLCQLQGATLTQTQAP